MATQIQTETKANRKGDELVDVSRAVGRRTEASRTASSDYLDLCEKTVERFADLEVKSAQAIGLPLVATIAGTHAAVSRRLAGAYVKAARDLSTPSRRRTITLRDGARATLRPIAPEDKPLVAASFERLSEESRYRRFLTTKNELSPAELACLVDVDHQDHEAIIAVDPSSGEALGVARYIRFKDDAEVAEVAVTVADDWQRRGLGRALLDRLTYRARREGVRRFSALVQGENVGGPQAARGRRRHPAPVAHRRGRARHRTAPQTRDWGAARPGAASGGCRKSGPGEDARPPRRRRRGVVAAPTRATWVARTRRRRRTLAIVSKRCVVAGAGGAGQRGAQQLLQARAPRAFIVTFRYRTWATWTARRPRGISIGA